MKNEVSKIKRISFLFRLLFQALFVSLPLLLAIAWTTSPDSLVIFNGFINLAFIPKAYLATASHSSAILHTLSAQERLLGFFVSALPITIQLYIIYSLIKLFKLYEIGEIFSINHVRYIKNIGYALVIGQLINPLYEGIMGVILTWHNPPGHRFAAITFDQTNMGVLFIALMMILISWIMTEGCKLRDEQQLTI
jgi:hypothetical protein